MLEKIIQKNILSFLREVGIEAWPNKTQGTYDPVKNIYRKPIDNFTIRGVPDIIGYLPHGQFLGIEVKSVKGRLSPEQKLFIDKAAKHNTVVFVARSVTQAFESLKPYLSLWQNYEHIADKYAKIERSYET
jgi:hypothetical protein